MEEILASSRLNKAGLLQLLSLSLGLKGRLVEFYVKILVVFDTKNISCSNEILELDLEKYHMVWNHDNI